MNEFPATADRFYELRDDRTNRCGVGAEYQHVACAVYLAPSAALTATGQAMLLASCNLLSRWCRSVIIIVPTVRTHATLGMGEGDLGALVLSQMRDADPFGNFCTAVSAPSDTAIALYIGYDATDTAHGVGIFINASGWLAGVGRQPINLPKGIDENHLGAIAAACFGVAQAFKFAIDVPPDNYIRDGIFDLYRMSWTDDAIQASWPNTLDVGNLLMVGAGSVGSAAAYCMRLIRLAGSITIIDRDTVKVENFNRSPIFGRQSYGMPKAKAVADFLADSSLKPAFEVSWWDDFVKNRPRTAFDFDIWIPLANEFGVRRAIQSNIPPLVIHASTTANWGVNHGRHIPGRDDCLADRFAAEVQSYEFTCATGSTETPGGQVVDAALPFASLFAGLLIAADLVRSQLADYPQVPNFALFDWYGSFGIIQAWDHKPREGCVCQDQGVTFHERFNKTTRYRHLFFGR